MPSFPQFLENLRKRLNRQLAINFGAATLAFGAAAALVYCLVFVLRGYSVPPGGFLAILALALACGALFWFLRRRSAADAARFADRHWRLKDMFITAWHLHRNPPEGTDDKAEHEAAAIVRRQASERAADLRARDVPMRIPRKAAAFGALAFLASLWLLSLPPSPAVQRRIGVEQMTTQRTAEARKALLEEIKGLEKQLDDDEKETLRLNELKQWVENLKNTGDQREALKQFARLEQKIAKRLDALDQRKDEQLLKHVAAELKKSMSPKARDLAKDLDAKQYKEASKKLENLKLAKNRKNKDAKSPTPEQKHKKLAERQKELARLRALTKRMAAANRTAGRRPKSAKPGKPSKSTAPSEVHPGEAGEDLAEMLDELDEDAAELEKELRELELSEDPGDPEDGQPGETAGKIDGDLGKLARRLGKMHARRKARTKLKGLRSCLSRAQCYAMGQCQSLSMPGGKKAGSGIDGSRRKEKSPLVDNGQFTKLKGQKGKGPSQTTIEEAQSGTGTSHRTAAARSHSYQRMFESFVRRDDIPEDLKSAVRQYLESIHDPPAESAPGPRESR